MNNEDKVNINIEDNVNSEIESNHTLSFKNKHSIYKTIHFDRNDIIWNE